MFSFDSQLKLIFLNHFSIHFYRDFSKIVCSTSNQTVHLFDLNTVKGYSQISHVDVNNLNGGDGSSICGLRFSNSNENVLYIGTVDGGVNILDLRKPSKTSQNISFETEDPLTCIDLNANDTILCAGTEQSKGEAHLLLYDLRQNSRLASYDDSHKDDVTQVKFHPTNPNALASGSTDGLINAYDISEASEDDALEYCLNTESSVQTINWHPTAKSDENLLSCITHTNDFQLYNVEESEIKYQCTREEICKFIKRKSVPETYLVNSHSTMDGSVLLLAGSNFNGGEVLRSLTFAEDKFVPISHFGNNKQIVRCSLYNAAVSIPR